MSASGRLADHGEAACRGQLVTLSRHKRQFFRCGSKGALATDEVLNCRPTLRRGRQLCEVAMTFAPITARAIPKLSELSFPFPPADVRPISTA